MNDNRERADIKGMNCSRWRCCECYRGLGHDIGDDKELPHNYCTIHGKVEPIDILVDERAQVAAAEIRLWAILGELTIDSEIKWKALKNMTEDME